MSIRQSLATTTRKQLEKNWLNDLTSSKSQKKPPNKPQVKMHLPPTPTPCGSQGWDGGRLSRSGLASPHRTEKLSASVPPVSCWSMEQPVYGACNALTSATARTWHRGQEQPGIDKHTFFPLHRGGGVPVTACVPQRELWQSHLWNLGKAQDTTSKPSSLAPQLRGWRL